MPLVKTDHTELYDNINIKIRTEDLLFALTSNGEFKNDIINQLVAKIVVVNKNMEFNFLELFKILNHLRINNLFIFSIHGSKEEVQKFEIVDKLCSIFYIEINIEDFKQLLKNPNPNSILGYFFQYNKKSLYILRDNNYIDVKNLFTDIEGYRVNIGRGGGQKAHLVSPLEFRLSTYLMAICNMNYQLFSSLNTFNSINKKRYLLYTNYNK